MDKIIVDSTCDLSEEIKEAYGIDVIPLNIVSSSHCGPGTLGVVFCRGK